MGKINDNLEQQAQAIFNSYFMGFDSLDANVNLPSGWQYTNLGKVTKNIRKKVKDKLYPVFSAVKDGTLKLSEDYFTKQVYSKHLNNYITVEKNQFAYNPARINIGSIGLNDYGFVGCVSPVYVVFEVDYDYQYFFNFFIKTKRFMEEVKTRCSGSVRQSLTYDDFSLINIVYPAKEAIYKFNKLYEPILAHIQYLTKENKKLIAIRDTLLPQLMSGELDVSELDI